LITPRDGNLLGRRKLRDTNLLMLSLKIRL